MRRPRMVCFDRSPWGAAALSRSGRMGSGLMVRLTLRSALCVCLLVIIGVSLFAADAWAQRELRVAVSSAQLVNFRAPARSVFIADPAIADLQVASPDSVI